MTQYTSGNSLNNRYGYAKKGCVYPRETKSLSNHNGVGDENLT